MLHPANYLPLKQHMTQLLWLEMTLFSKIKSITQYRKTFITQPKHIFFLFKQKGLSLGSDFTISEKKVFCFGRGLWGPHFYCTSWTEK